MAQTLLEQEVDVYLCSFPEAGGRANLEAMAAGYRPFVPVLDTAPELLRFDFHTPTWAHISRPEELPAAIAAAHARSPAEIEQDATLTWGELKCLERYAVGGLRRAAAT